MRTIYSLWKKVRWLILISVTGACVDVFILEGPETQFQIVVEGMISDNPGPYTVKVSRTISLNADTAIRSPIRNVRIKLFDDSGNSEDLTESGPGIYITGGAIQGQIGRSYYITLETEEGKTFKSEPDTLKPGGVLEQINFEYEARTVAKGVYQVVADVFNLYIDGSGGSGKDHYVRWRYTGTYKVLTFPQYHSIFSEGSAYIDPLPCSGFVVEPALGGGKLVQMTECTCCTCWCNQFERVPQVFDGQFVAANEYKRVKVGEVPITNNTFYDKYLVVVEQMSLTKRTFDYFNRIHMQIENASSLFQPPSGQINGNLVGVNTSAPILGYFWATSMSSKKIFIQKSDIPYVVGPIDGVFVECFTFYSNATTTEPALWE